MGGRATACEYRVPWSTEGALCCAIQFVCKFKCRRSWRACEPAKNGKAVSFWNKRRELRQRDEAAPSLIDEAVPVDVS